MKKIYIIVGAIFLLLSIAYMLIQSGNVDDDSTSQGDVTFPIARDLDNVPDDALLNINTKNGYIRVNNFMMNDDTYADTYNPGYYYLGNTFTDSQIEEIPSFVIAYIDETNFFNITLLKEPIRDSRIRAETYLKDALGISAVEMCTLQYTLSVPAYVNEAYSGIDLRFSFCPESLSL